jgi:hypothetical protein
MLLQQRMLAGLAQVGVYHFFNQLVEGDFGFPAQRLS